MSMKSAPTWTGVIIGLLFGMLVGAAWYIGGGSDQAAAPDSVAVAASAAGGGVSAQAATTVSDSAAVGNGSDAVSGLGSVAGIGSGRRNAIVRATEMVAPAVVSINVIQHRTVTRSLAPRGMEFWDRFYPGLFPRRQLQQDVSSLGSGVIVSADGYVVTNTHVVEGGDEVLVTLNDGRRFVAQIIETVSNWDLALLKIEGEDLPAARLAVDQDDLFIGEWAIAIGSPFGYLLADTQPTVTVGVISAMNRDIKQSSGGREYLGMIQTDAAINPGNSGGPLVNGEGEVIGINTFIFTESGGSIGLGFAVPIQRARWVLEDVRRYGYYRQVYSGLVMQMLSEPLMQALELKGDPTGFVVREVVEGSPAWKAGLRVYDVLRSIDGVPLKDKATIDRLVYEATVGTSLHYVAERDGEEFSGTIVLEEAPRGEE